jgi:hypothetical protein
LFFFNSLSLSVCVCVSSYLQNSDVITYSPTMFSISCLLQQVQVLLFRIMRGIRYHPSPQVLLTKVAICVCITLLMWALLMWRPRMGV